MLMGVIMLLLRRNLLGHYIGKQQKKINKGMQCLLWMY